MISTILPETGDMTSCAALSVSSSTIASSTETLSPTFLYHSPTPASVTDSPALGTGTSTILPLAAAGLGASASRSEGVGLTGEAAPPSAMMPSSAPTSTVSPSLTEISPKVPAAGAGTSTETLSVSNSTIGSSMATASPGFFNHWPTVASLTDSPRVGTRISFAMILLLFFESEQTGKICCAEYFKITQQFIARHPMHLPGMHQVRINVWT